MPILSLERLTFDPSKNIRPTDLNDMIGKQHNLLRTGGKQNGIVTEIYTLEVNDDGIVTYAELFIQV